MNSSCLLERDFLSSKTFFIQGFVETFEIREWQFLLVDTDILASRTFFSHFSDTPSGEAIFRLKETYF